MSLDRFILEDVGDGDATSDALLGEERASARIFARQDCVAAGIEEACRVFEELGAKAEARKRDGERCKGGDALLVASGLAKALLAGERLALNLIGRMSGIATETSRVVGMARKANPKVRIAATRKTTPGFRLYEKKAVELGGGERHRFNLGDAILVKDNHIALVGSVGEAVRRANKRGHGRQVEVEAGTLEEALEGARAGADTVMLDNMTPEKCAEAYQRLKAEFPKVTVEASGGITPENIAKYAPHADVISLGWLTHSAKAVDVSMEFEREK